MVRLMYDRMGWDRMDGLGVFRSTTNKSGPT